MAKPTIVTRAGKGSALTWTEGDANLTNLRDATITVTDGTNSKALNLNDTLAFTAGTNITLAVDSGTGAVTINSTASGGATTLDGLSDVVITAASTNDFLSYNGTNWVDTHPSDALTKLTGFTTTATAAGTTTLTNTSTFYQIFTGSTTQTVVLPSTATLAQGWSFHICNNSTGILTLQTSTLSTITTIPAGLTIMATCVSTAGNTTSAWETGFTDFSTRTGIGDVVLATGPTITNGVYNGTVGATTPASGAFTTLSASTSVSFNPSGAITLNPTTAGSINNMSVGATTASTGAFTTLSASSTVSGTGFSTYLASPPAIGGTTAAAGTFTGLVAKGATTTPKLTLDTTALNHAGQWNTNGVGLRIQAATFTDTVSSGAVATAHINAIAAPTIGFNAAATVADAATLYVAGGPIAGVATTITNSWALLANGKVKSNGDLVLGAGLNAGGSLGSSGQVLQSTGTGVQWATAGGSAPPFAIVSGTILNQEFTGFVNAAIAETTLPHTWSELYDPSNLVTVSTDTVTISAAGTYLIEYKSNYIPWWSMSANAASGGRALPEATFKLYNSTDATTLGSSIIGAGSNYITSGFTYTFYEKQIMFTSVITIAASKSLTIRYAISQPSAGVYNNTGTKLVYTSNPSTPKMKITKLA